MFVLDKYFFFNMYFGYSSKTISDNPDFQGSELLCSSSSGSSHILKNIREKQ